MKHRAPSLASSADNSDGPAPMAAGDLLLGLAGILLLVLALVQTGRSNMVLSAPPDTKAAATNLAQANSLMMAYAEVETVHLFTPDRPSLTLPIASLPDAPELSAWADAAQQPIVIFAANSVDTAFLLEVGLARTGLEDIRKVRLPGPCATLEMDDDTVTCGSLQ